MILQSSRVIEEYKSLEELTLIRLRQAILNGELKPGEKLRQHELAAYLRVSRMPIRVVLRRLEAEGLVTISRGGAVVSKLSTEEAEELYAARVGLEGLAARLGAEKATPESLEEMRSLLPPMQQAADAESTATFISLDRDFHLAQYRPAGRIGLTNKIIALWASSDRYGRVVVTLGKIKQAAMETHRALLDASERRDGKLAERLTRDYLDRSARTLVSSLRDQQPPLPDRHAASLVVSGLPSIPSVSNRLD